MSEKRLAKPLMRGLYARKLKIHLVGAVVTSLLSGLAWKIFYMDPRKRDFEKFMNYYDPEIHLQIMTDAGLLQSAPQAK